MFTGRVLFYVIFAFFASLAFTYLWIKVAPRLGMVDHPASHKIHSQLTPRGGGISFAIIWLLAAYLATFLTGLANEVLKPALAIANGAMIIIAVGLMDDLYDLRPHIKLVGQASAAVVAVTAFQLPASPIGIILTISYFCWILALTNAFNLIDGLDGLAAGVAAIAAGAFVILGLLTAKPLMVAFSAILFMSCLGFLFFNWHPAKVFMGDTGSLFLGYALGSISLLSLTVPAKVGDIVAPLLILGVPLFDMVLSIARRSLNHQSLFTSDTRHFYNILMQRGFSHEKAVLSAYLMGILLGAIGLAQTYTETAWSLLVMLAMISFLALYTTRLRLLRGDV